MGFFGWLIEGRSDNRRWWEKEPPTEEIIASLVKRAKDGAHCRFKSRTGSFVEVWLKKPSKCAEGGQFDCRITTSETIYRDSGRVGKGNEFIMNKYSTKYKVKGGRVFGQKDSKTLWKVHEMLESLVANSDRA